MTLIELATKLRPIIEKSAQSLDDATALEAVTLFPAWAAGVAYTAGTKVKHGGVLYSVLQDHTSQAGWEPGAAPSLFAKVLIPDPDVIPEWEQPDSTNPYKNGDKVRFEGKVYESLIDNNVWSPSAYPAGWQQKRRDKMGSVTISADTIITIAAVITALGVIFGVIFAIYKWYLKQEKQDKDIAHIKEEDTLIVFALSACLDGLQQLGANHTVPIAKDKLDKYINQQAHK